MSDPNIEAVYPLSPTQEGMLFHTLYEEGSQVYFQQLTFSLEGPLDAGAFARAWRIATQRHAILRTVFLWDRQKKPLQVVRRSVSPDWREEDWTARTEPGGDEALEAFLEVDRRIAFEPSKVPPVRYSLIKLAPTRHHFVWSFHHLLLDGWSVALLLREVQEAYHALRRGAEPTLA
ncbi:MAG TPA: condensation domain-containing protein, partial [Vicinamibacteria bacterium]